MNSPDFRINARLTGEDARRFRELQKREGLSASDLLREALRAYHAARMPVRANAFAVLNRTGFLGAGDGPADLATRYKEYLGDALEKKYPLAVHDGDGP